MSAKMYLEKTVRVQNPWTTRDDLPRIACVPDWCARHMAVLENFKSMRIDLVGAGVPNSVRRPGCRRAMSLVHAAASIINAELLATLAAMSDSSDDELPVDSRGAQFFSDNLAARVNEQWDRLTHGEFGRYTSGRSVDTKDPQPSHRLATATPDAGRLAAAAADRSLDSARALMGEDWTNRLASLLPRGWAMGPCAGGRDGPVVRAAADLERF